MQPSLSRLIPLGALLALPLPVKAYADADLAAQQKRGQALFLTCAACHGANGQGLPTNPPMAPGLTQSPLANGPAEVAAAIVLKGVQKTDSKYIGMMLPLGGTLNDEQLADVLTDVRTSLAETKASAVTAEQVKGWREKYKAITQPLSRATYEKKAAQLAKESAAAKPGAGESSASAPAEPAGAGSSAPQ